MIFQLLIVVFILFGKKMDDVQPGLRWETRRKMVFLIGFRSWPRWEG